MNRNDFLKTLFAGVLIPTVLNNTARARNNNVKNKLPKTPVLFISTGTPSNIIEDNPYTQVLKAFGKKINRPSAIVVISSQWISNGSFITTSSAPEQLHDYKGMSDEYYEIKYPMIGDADLSQKIIKLISSHTFQSDIDRGIDTGAWGVARQLFPEGNLPMIQLSLNQYIPPSHHFEIAKQIKTLREQGVLFICTGNIVHNTKFMHKDRDAAPYFWAKNFDTFVKDALEGKKTNKLIDFRAESTAAKLSVPANQQYLPLLYAVGLQDKDEDVNFIYEGFEHASISLRSFVIGEQKS